MGTTLENRFEEKGEITGEKGELEMSLVGRVEDWSVLREKVDRLAWLGLDIWHA